MWAMLLVVEMKVRKKRGRVMKTVMVWTKGVLVVVLLGRST